jgi:hypothetical protein
MPSADGVKYIDTSPNSGSKAMTFCSFRAADRPTDEVGARAVSALSGEICAYLYRKDLA